ncbi:MULTISPECIES: amidase domain-containing protein [unclassified Streptomyces]|uniref:amidase domain-containing protein n=1 Tax=unclassified Streptomyces TaxID=2593676 RepID=UPI00225A0FB0|nr:MULTISPECIES: amidase domain-containing protein [unclassified Streptomyces]MCX4991207.1 amidase domain-containing protein [Streptomyces sp. NBC_00568]MCX5003556.1 amidase domain-containing protein [Streptomyces sp. NBC_00638]
MISKKLSRSCSTVGAITLSALLLPLSAAHAAAPTPRVTASTADAFGRVADAVFTDRTAALLDRAPTARTALKATTAGIRVSGTLAHTESAAVSSLHGTRSRLAALGEAYSAGDTRVTVNRTRVTGQRATAWVTETTTLTYRKIRGDEPATTGFRAHHVLTFAAQADGTWKLTGERSTDKGPRQVNEPVTTTPRRTTMAAVDAPRAATTYPAPANAKKLTGAPYDYAAMATYAETYWKNYNPAYRSFNAVGGDCTNYLSQVLKAGGWATVTSSDEEYGTWNYGTSSQTDTWVGVNEWSWFTQTARRSTPLANVYQMDIGDVMQMDFDKDGSKDHSMITSYRSSGGVPYLTYHDADTYRRSVSSLIASYPNSAFYAYRT